MVRQTEKKPISLSVVEDGVVVVVAAAVAETAGSAVLLQYCFDLAFVDEKEMN